MSDTPLSRQLALWQRRDLLRRLGESGIRAGCWSLLLAALAPPSWVGWGVLAAVGAEGIRALRARRSPAAVAASVDEAGATHGLLSAGLAAESGTAWGAPDLIALVRQQAAGAAPGLSDHAVRPLALPRAALALGVVGLIVLSLGRDAAAPAGGIRHTDRSPVAELLSPSPPVPDASAPMPVTGQVVGSQGELLGGDAKARADQGEGDGGATGAAGGGASTGTARQGAESAGGGSEAGAAPTGAGGTSADGAAEGSNTASTGGLDRDRTEAEEGGGSDPDAVALEESAEKSTQAEALRDPYGNEQDTLHGEDPDRLEKHYTDLDNSVGAGTLTPESTSALTQDFEETATMTMGMALAGQGGINDAPGTVNLLAPPSAEDIETTEAWIAARWRESAAGTIQSIDGGQSGGQSSLQWVELYDNYATIAEARMHREEIPPGRRDYVRAYFESIRSTP